MANSIILKKSSVAAKIPLTTDLAYGELALNYTDDKLYFKNASNVIKSFAVSESILLDDVSGSADSSKAVFSLKQNGVALSTSYIVDSKDLQVTVDGKRLQPYTQDGDFMFMPAYDACKGFRVRENRLIIYNAPEIGSQITIVVQKTSPTKQTRRYPFSATNIGLGD